MKTANAINEIINLHSQLKLKRLCFEAIIHIQLHNSNLDGVVLAIMHLVKRAWIMAISFASWSMFGYFNYLETMRIMPRLPLSSSLNWDLNNLDWRIKHEH